MQATREMPVTAREVTTLEAFGETRLHQVARLAALEREHGDALNELGCVLVTRTMITLVQDCFATGIAEERVVAALKGTQK